LNKISYYLNQFNHPTQAVNHKAELYEVLDLDPYQNFGIITSPSLRNQQSFLDLQEFLGHRQICLIDDVSPNPSLQELSTYLLKVETCGIDHLIAVGGGSVIDTSKVLAKYIPNQSVKNLTKVLIDNKNVSQLQKALRLSTIPTTAGSGSEFTSFATIWDKSTNTKFSLDSLDLYPSVAFLNPLTLSELPFEVSISSGLDAISHALESFWSASANTQTKKCAIESLSLSLFSSFESKKHFKTIQSREMMMTASSLSGIAISQTRTGLAHAISYPLTLHFGVPHGIAASFTLSSLIEYNMKVADINFDELLNLLNLNSVEDLTNKIDNIFKESGAASVLKSKIGQPSTIIKLVNEMLSNKRAQNSLNPASEKDLVSILERSLARIDI
jgi:phosphonate metabolism-associated iron-containing alcohol dehydrogenase